MEYGTAREADIEAGAAALTGDTARVYTTAHLPEPLNAQRATRR